MTWWILFGAGLTFLTLVLAGAFNDKMVFIPITNRKRSSSQFFFGTLSINNFTSIGHNNLQNFKSQNRFAVK